MLSRLIFFSLLLLGTTGESGAVIPMKVDLEVIVEFAPGSSDLSSGETLKLNEAIARVKRENWCALELAVVVGYARSGEVQPVAAKTFTEQRAAGVVLALVQLGVQPSVIYSEGKGIAPSVHLAGSNFGPHVVLGLQGVPPAADCGDTRRRDGLRR
jgi:hypothetical protein